MCGDFLNGQTAADSYPDITDGAQVVVTDSSGKVIGTGTLASTRIPARVTKIDGASLAGEFEAFKFTVKLPSGQPRYGIKVGGSNRGTVWFSPAQMSKGPSVSLGC